MRMTAAVAGIKTVLTRGLAAAATALSVWSENSERLASRLSNHFATH